MTRGCIFDNLASLYFLEDLAYFCFARIYEGYEKYIQIFVGTPEEKIPLGGYKCCWDDTPPSKIAYSGLHL
jgi:hypothetical protein